MVGVEGRPAVTAEDAHAWAASAFGIDARARELPSERDRNFVLEDGAGRRFVLKVANRGESARWLGCENAVLQRLAARDRAEPPRFPRVLRNRDGGELTQIAFAGETLLVRALSWVPGTALARFRPHRPPLLRALGRLLAELDEALRGFEHEALDRVFAWDLRCAGACLARAPAAFGGDARAAPIARLAEAWAAIEPRLAALRTSAIHGDANDHNVLVDAAGPRAAPRVGLIDFGDMVRGPAVAELAVGAAYAMLGKADPLAAAAHVVAGYHAAAPLRETEVELIGPLIRARLGLSAVLAAEQRRAAPENDYLSISETAVWQLLHRLDAEIAPPLVHAALRRACGFRASPRADRVAAWLDEQRAALAPVLPFDAAREPHVVLDLSVARGDPGTGGDDAAAWTARIDERRRAAGARLALGRWGEARLCYTAPQFAVPADETTSTRTVHLGVDLFVDAGTPVHAPLDGTVHSVACNDAPLDYGPTLILEHRTGDGLPFWTLYGHLAGDALRLRPGAPIARGTPFARIGAPPENGGWPPHLHLQLISDMLGRAGDFPGVAAPDARELWLELCPDPSVLVGVPVAAPRAGPGALRARRRALLGPSLSLAYGEPLHLVRGLGARLWDADGRVYLDAVNNVCHVGHAHPRVVEAACAQMAALNTNTRYLHENALRYAERLGALLPEPLRVCFFVCSGSEANELALRLARAHTGRRDVIAVDGAYHGNTQALIDVSAYKHAGPGGAGAPAWVHVVPMPDRYRGPYRGADAGVRYAAHVAEAAAAARGGPAAFLCESLLGCGGQIVLPDGYLREAYAAVRAAGGVCIADEVQVGFGRVGTHFWGFATQGVVPDIVTLGKPIGNGHPLAAVVTTPQIAGSFANGMEYFNTFGGNPVSCAVGLAVLDVIAEERLQERAQRVGARLRAGLEELGREMGLIGDVRGLGLFLGVELVTDREGRTPAPEHAAYVVERLRERGILVGIDGPQHNVLKIKPPLVFGEGEADWVVGVLREVMEESAVAGG